MWQEPVEPALSPTLSSIYVLTLLLPFLFILSQKKRRKLNKSMNNAKEQNKKPPEKTLFFPLST
jgi:hypothetical protein